MQAIQLPFLIFVPEGQQARKETRQEISSNQAALPEALSGSQTRHQSEEDTGESSRHWRRQRHRIPTTSALVRCTTPSTSRFRWLRCNPARR